MILAAMNQVIILLVCAVAAIAAPVTEHAHQSVGELGEYFEGDMVLTAEQRASIEEAQKTRNGLRDVSYRWPENTVVYHIKEDHFDEVQLKKIEDGMADIANKSCIKFRRRDTEKHYLTIQGSEMGCFSNVGYDPNEGNKLNLYKTCFSHGTIVHEMLHTLGFYHMQSTYDRDEYVTIVCENIIEEQKHNFRKYNIDTVTNYGVEYDYKSVMHYGKDAFSKNGKDTIIVLKENVTIGQRIGMSEGDVIKLNKMYCEHRHS